jgi:Ca2+-binding EF-hand superfamily protein
MRSLGACEADAEQMLHALDVDADGRIDFDEFCACASPLYKSSTTALRRAFDFFDLDG